MQCYYRSYILCKIRSYVYKLLHAVFSQMIVQLQPLTQMFCQLLVRCAFTWLPFLSQLSLHYYFVLRNHVHNIHPLIHSGFFNFYAVLLKYIQSAITVLFCTPILKSSGLALLPTLSNYSLANRQHEAILGYFMFAFLLPNGCLSFPAQVLFYICVLSGVQSFHFHVSSLMSF